MKKVYSKIAMAVIAVLVGSSLISGIGAPDEVDTGEAISDIRPEMSIPLL